MSFAVVVLAAGYGTRLQKDIESDPSPEFRNLLSLPKPLLPLSDKPLLNYWLSLFETCSDLIDGIHLVTNKRYHQGFVEWSQSAPTLAATSIPVDIICDNTESNEDRLGGVADMLLAIQSCQISKNLIVIAGDTLFFPSFSLRAYLDRFRELSPTQSGPYGVVCSYPLSDHNEVSKRGIIEVDSVGLVTQFLEKPQPSDTASNLAVPAVYLYSSGIISILSRFVQIETKSRDERDAPGLFLRHLCQAQKDLVRIYTFGIEGRFDVGGLREYKKCDAFFRQYKSKILCVPTFLPAVSETPGSD